MKALALSKMKSKRTGELVHPVVNGVRFGDEPMVCPDGFVETLRKTPWADLIASETAEDMKPWGDADLAGKTLLAWRSGGFGDILFLTPLLRKIKRTWPTCRLWFATQPNYHAALAGNPHVDAVLTLPIPIAAFREADYHLHFEGTIERSTDPAAHAVDLLAEHAGIELGPDEKGIVYQPSLPRVAAMRNRLVVLGVRMDLPIVAVQPKASSPVRTYPPDMLAKAIKKLVDAGNQVIVLGGPKDFPAKARMGGVWDLCGAFENMADSVAALANADLLVAPDSSLTHFAGAMGIPTVAIYGPFPGAVRTAYYDDCTTLEVDSVKWPCAPCFIHGHRPCPRAQKRSQTFSPCFETIEPGMIVAAAKAALAQRKPRWRQFEVEAEAMARGEHDAVLKMAAEAAKKTVADIRRQVFGVLP